MKFHGIPRSLKCDQAQAFRTRNFEFFCKDNNVRLILAPAGDHRGTSMVEKLIQTIKRRLAAINIDNNWSKKNIRKQNIGSNGKHKTHSKHNDKNHTIRSTFRQKTKQQTSNIVTYPNKKSLSYNNIRKFYLDARWDQQSMWNFSDSEPNLDIQYNTPANSDADSDTTPLARQAQNKRKHISPIKITPDKLSITFGDKTSVLI